MADTVLMETIDKNIKRYREKAHLTQAELAELVEVENAFISRVGGNYAISHLVGSL